MIIGNKKLLLNENTECSWDVQNLIQCKKEKNQIICWIFFYHPVLEYYIKFINKIVIKGKRWSPVSNTST